jgi:cell wall assembly regulator SMI1
MPAALLSRLLALLVGSALADVSAVEVPDPDAAIVDNLIAASPNWIGVLGTASPNSVTVNLSATPQTWRIGQMLPKRVDRTAIYVVTEGMWRIATGPP